MPRQRIGSEDPNKRPQKSCGHIAIIGVGNMGAAFARGLIAKGYGSSLLLIDPNAAPEQWQSFLQSGATRIEDPSALRSFTVDAILLAVKPQILSAVVKEYATVVGDSTVISLAAGSTVQSITGWFGKPVSLIRAMPNLPASIGRGITAAFRPPSTADVHVARAHSILSAAGELVWVEDESHLNAVTAVSGSGPAYVFYLVEALTAAAENAGLPPDVASKLARSTVEGAGALLSESSATPEELRASVTSPGGTTAAALNVLMSKNALESLISAAVKAATERAAELAR